MHRIIEANQKEGRYTFFTNDFKLKKIPSGLCFLNNQNSSESEGETKAASTTESDETADGECNLVGYVEGLALVSGIALIAAVILFPVTFTALGLGRCCCCGRYKPTPSLCCGSPDDFDPLVDGYRKCSVMVLFVLAIVCGVAMAVGAGFGLAGNTVMTKSMKELGNFTGEAADRLMNLVSAVADVFDTLAEEGTELVSSDDEINIVDAARNVGGNMINITRKVARNIDKFDIPRQVLIYFTLLFPLVLTIILVLSCCCCSCLSWLMAFFGFIIAALALVMFSVHLPISHGLSDVCVYVDKALNSSNYEFNQYTERIFDCGEGSPIAKLTDLANDVMNKSTELACGVFDSLCSKTIPCERGNDGVIDLTGEEDKCTVVNCELNKTEACNLTTLPKWASQGMYKWKIGCYKQDSQTHYTRVGECPYSETLTSLFSDECDALGAATGDKYIPLYCNGDSKQAISAEECAENCTDEDMRSNSTRVVRFVDSATKVLDVYNEQIKPYLNCETVTRLTDYAKDFFCVDIILASTPIYIGEIITAVACAVATIVALLATKRFNKKYRREYARKRSEEGAEMA